MTTHSTRNRQTFKPQAAFSPQIPAIERSQTYALDRAATGIGTFIVTWIHNKVRELIAVKVLHTSLLNTTVVAFKVLPLGSYAPMPAPSLPFKTISQMVLWNGLQSCRCIIPDVISVIKMPSFQYFLHLLEQKKVTGGQIR